ncbi:cysteine desulfurase-like protein [Vibrio sp. WXL210]|uniref:cysteine desulfurase-like protein n=1 Tax=Vibrio sp. WXL210 TaxID=3450709 RepID=UPI003EC6DABF
MIERVEEIDVELLRSQFPALYQSHNDRPVVFFDGPGGTQVPRTVLDAMVGYLGYSNANLGGHYFTSNITQDLVTKAREYAAQLLNAQDGKQIVFGANMTTLTFALSRSIGRDWQAGDEVVVSSLDHFANVSSWQALASDRGADVRQARVDVETGGVDIDHLISLITPSTKLVALTMASNVTGTLVEVQRVIEAAKQVGALVYLDAVHYVPHRLVDVQALGCDFLVCSAYKFFGPHLGIAYIAPQHLERLRPYKVTPAPSQGPGRFETGTLNFESLAGFCAAVDYLAAISGSEPSGTEGSGRQGTLRVRLERSFALIARHESRLSKHFLKMLTRLPGIRVFGHTLPNYELRTPTFALDVADLSPHHVAKVLGGHNLCVWSGHFYAPDLIEQLGCEQKGGVVRVGMMHYNTLAEIDRLEQALVSLLE